MSPDLKRNTNDVNGFTGRLIDRLTSQGQNQLPPGQTDRVTIPICPQFKARKCAFDPTITGSLQPNCGDCSYSNQMLNTAADNAAQELRSRGHAPVKKIPLINPDNPTIHGILVKTPRVDMRWTQGGAYTSNPPEGSDDASSGSIRAMAWGPILIESTRSNLTGPNIAQRKKESAPVAKPTIPENIRQRSDKKIKNAEQSGTGGVLHRESSISRAVKGFFKIK